jgi:hypothetical protein
MRDVSLLDRGTSSEINKSRSVQFAGKSPGRHNFEGLLISGSKRGMIALPDVGAALPEEARVRDRLRKLN